MRELPFVRVLAVVVGSVASMVVHSDVVIRPQRVFGLGDVSRVELSRDQRHLATAGQSGAFLWDYTKGELRHKLESHGWRISAIAFSPDSRLLVTAGNDRLIRAWDVESGTELRTYAGHEGEIGSLVFSSDGRTLLSASADNTARVWSTDTGSQTQLIRVQGAPIQTAVFTPDGHRIVTSATAMRARVQVWNVADGELVKTLPDHVSITYALGFTHAGRLMSVGDDLQVRIWDIDSGQQLRAFGGATLAAIGISISEQDSSVTVGCLDGRVVTWNSETGEQLQNVQFDPMLAFWRTSDSNEIVTANGDNGVRLRELPSGRVIRTFLGHTTSVTQGVGFSPDGRLVLSGGLEASIRLWDRNDGRLIRIFEGHGGGTMAAAFSPNGTLILSTRGAPQPAAQLWNTESGTLVREFKWTAGWPMSASFFPDGTRVITGAQDEKVRVWDVATGTNLRTLSQSGWARSVAASPDGQWIASGSTDSNVRLWNAQAPQPTRTFHLNAGAAVTVAFSPSGEQLAAGWEDGFIRLFDVSTGALVQEIVSEAAFLNKVCFSPDGQFLLAGEGWPTFTATLWDLRSGKSVRVFSGHRWDVGAVAFNSTGTQILTGADTVRLWNIEDIAIRLQARRAPAGVELQWGTGTLQSSTIAGGPWHDVAEATAPWTVPSDQASEYFRVRPTASE